MLRREEIAARWRKTALMTLDSAKALKDSNDPRSCVSRAYYAAYQAATSICILHGDESQFPAGWHNPTHDQLPDLIANNGDLTRETRWFVRRLLRDLRDARETADYRIAVTVDEQTRIKALDSVSELFRELGI